MGAKAEFQLERRSTREVESWRTRRWRTEYKPELLLHGYERHKM